MNMKYLAMAIAGLFVFGIAHAEDKKVLTNKTEKLSYSMGYNIGTVWKRQSIETNDVDLATMISAIQDAMAGHPSLLTEQENRDAVTAFRNELRSRVEEKRKVLAEKNKKEGAAYLAENKTKPGVHTLPNGLQYKIITEGTGPKPTTNDTVSVNYKGTLIDGTEFDSSYKRGQPATFRVTGVIKGWTEALEMMPVGSKWELYIPSDLAYGERGSGMNIGPDATLIFEIELLALNPPKPTMNVHPVTNHQQVTSDIIKVPSAEEIKKGAKIEIIKPDQIEKEKQKQ
jgi:FKBP-type peptidyl-prolyl cis-trans isomerase FklB